MTRRVVQFRLPERFIVGTVGLPGERTFYLQVRDNNELFSVAFEKQQATVLADRVDQLLDEVVATRNLAETIPSAIPAGLVDNDPLDVPLTEEFRVGAMALGWDDSVQQVVIEAHAIAGEGEDVPELADDSDEGPDTLRVWLSPTYARAFAQRARAVVDAGRPPCPFCQQPLDATGHVCPRANGYRRRDLP